MCDEEITMQPPQSAIQNPDRDASYEFLVLSPKVKVLAIEAENLARCIFKHQNTTHEPHSSTTMKRLAGDHSELYIRETYDNKNVFETSTDSLFYKSKIKNNLFSKN